MLFAEVQTEVWIAMIAAFVAVMTAFLGTAGTIVAAVLSYKTKVAIDAGNAAQAKTSEKQAVEVAAVKTTLEDATKAADAKLDEIKATGDSTHVLVNSKMSVALEANLALAKELAAVRPGEQSAARVRDAEAKLAEHAEKQSAADAGQSLAKQAGRDEADPLHVKLVGPIPGDAKGG